MDTIDRSIECVHECMDTIDRSNACVNESRTRDYGCGFWGFDAFANGCVCHADRWMDYIHIQYEYEYQYETPRRGILCVFIRTYVRTDSLLES